MVACTGLPLRSVPLSVIVTPARPVSPLSCKPSLLASAKTLPEIESTGGMLAAVKPKFCALLPPGPRLATTSVPGVLAPKPAGRVTQT